MSRNRRQFLEGAAFTALSYGRVAGANDRIRLAGMGCGGRGRYLLQQCARAGGCEIIATCDVYAPRVRQTGSEMAPHAEAYSDHRRLLERRDLDAVVIGSPDHWHVPMTIDSIRAGKDVYVEKPVSHTIEEGKALRQAAAGSGRIVQIGYQQRSWEHFIEARKLIAAGQLGKIALVLSSWYQTYLAVDLDKLDVNPAELDWKRWLGPAPDQPFNALRYVRWRWFWDFGGGHLTDLHSHWGDTIHWFLDLEHPVNAQASGGNYAFDYVECPDTINCFWEYPGKVGVAYNGTMHCHLDGGTLVFRGDRAMMRINRDGFAVYPEGVVAKEKTQYPPALASMRSDHDGTIDHVRNFLECVRSRRTPNAPVEASVTAADAAHFGNLALRAKKQLAWQG